MPPVDAPPVVLSRSEFVAIMSDLDDVAWKLFDTDRALMQRLDNVIFRLHGLGDAVSSCPVHGKAV